MTQYITLSKQAKDITGQTFGRLTALGPIAQDAKKRFIWHFRCACGNTYTGIVTFVVRGNTQSCGCLFREIMIKRNKTHGMSHDPLYRIWADMIKRCRNPRSTHYKDYGGRGIAVHIEWQHDFMAFYDYVSALSHCGDEGYTLDRINNNGNYEPGNVQWATTSQQTRNQRRNRLYTYKGKSQCLAAWAEEYQIEYGRLKGRLKLGWTMEDALHNPVGVRRAGKNRPVYPFGEKHQHAKLNESHVAKIRKRAAQGEIYKVIANDYGVCEATIGKIVRRETWTHIP